MSARLVLLLAGLVALPSSAQALELKNIRPAHGPLGATRQGSKFLPGDYLFITYEIDGLKVDAKNKASFVTLVEVFDAKKMAVFKKETANVVVPDLGGSRIAGDFHVIMGTDRPPGQYKARLTVKDVIGNDIKSFEHPFELLPKDFGIVGVMAPAVAFPAQPYMLQYNIVELALDAAQKPNAKREIKILDETGKLVATPVVHNYPADLPEGIDLKKSNFIPVDFPLFPNRPGRFTIEVTVVDNLSKRNASVRYPLTVLDIGAIAGK
jgi:hypothetical protein